MKMWETERKRLQKEKKQQRLLKLNKNKKNTNNNQSSNINTNNNNNKKDLFIKANQEEIASNSTGVNNNNSDIPIDNSIVSEDESLFIIPPAVNSNISLTNTETDNGNIRDERNTTTLPQFILQFPLLKQFMKIMAYGSNNKSDSLFISGLFSYYLLSLSLIAFALSLWHS
jgi:hypothetical protein